LHMLLTSLPTRIVTVTFIAPNERGDHDWDRF
jgi:hypothetical protein